MSSLLNVTDGIPNPAVGAAPPIPPLDNTLGAFLLGTFFGVLLQGVVYHQAVRYFRLFPKDTLFLKGLVFFAVSLGTLNTALTIHTCYHYQITNFANPAVLTASPVWSLKILPAPGSFSALVTQLFFARRIYLFGRKYWIVAAIALLLTMSCCGLYTAITVTGWNKPDLSEFLANSYLATIGSAILMTADVLLTAVLMYALHTSRTGVKSTNSLIDVVILYSVTTGFLICIFLALNIAFSHIWPDNLIYAATSIILTKIYVMTLLAALNTRHTLAGYWESKHGESNGFRSTLFRSRPGGRVTEHRVDMPQDGRSLSQAEENEMMVMPKLAVHVVVDSQTTNDLDAKHDLEHGMR